MKKIEKERAIALRQAGNSINRIAQILNVSKSSVSLWVRHIQLTNDQSRQLQTRNNILDYKKPIGSKSKRRLDMGEDNWKIYQKQRRLDKAVAWQQNNAEYYVFYRERQKNKLIEYKGSKCEICGYNKDCPPAFHFHHVDPSKKEYTISQKSYCFETAKKEVDKCSLLCGNCHTELHYKKYIVSKLSTVNKLIGKN